MMWNDQMQRDSAIMSWRLLAHSLFLTTKTSGGSPWPHRLQQWSRAESSNTSKDLTCAAWLFSCATFCISCKFLRTVTPLQIMNSHSYRVRLSFQMSSQPLASRWFGCVGCSLLLLPSPAKEWCHLAWAEPLMSMNLTQFLCSAWICGQDLGETWCVHYK